MHASNCATSTPSISRDDLLVSLAHWVAPLGTHAMRLDPASVATEGDSAIADSPYRPRRALDWRSAEGIADRQEPGSLVPLER
ncbi:hypothetical protein GCM10010211_83470 [Streptomyces albospinus]|uniref:Uncharacterized protein n=1 Tax=Streptomyces albospinus TaxID=285515 RepID=A0ABQ2VRG3_9ACTN|nr:hypothetical protein GCM10010211_83470 [Streptomyces albospinus]